MKDVSIVRSHDTRLDVDYNAWLDEVGRRFEAARSRVVVKVNGEKLLWNWQVGRDLVMRKAEETWGAGVVEQLSLDLQNRFPGEKGFGVDSLWALKRWYLFYAEKLEQPVQEFLAEVHKGIKLEQSAQVIQDTAVNGGLEFPALFSLIPWGHHVEIVKKCKTLEEASFYLRRTIEEGWSRAALQRQLKADLFHKQGRAVTNFSEQFPPSQAALVQEMTKDSYAFGFLSLPMDYDERQLEDALCEQMTRFLLELGNGFAFVGRQKELVVAGRLRRIDLLFYHIRLRCYVVIELKVVPFEPEFVGKINYYVSAVDDLLKYPEDNPTIGLLICSDMNQTEVRYAFRGVDTPIGVSTYSDVQIEEIKRQLPSVEELRTRVRLLEDQLRREKK